MDNTKQHFKMYKIGKFWVSALITGIFSILGGVGIAQADVVPSSPNTEQTPTTIVSDKSVPDSAELSHNQVTDNTSTASVSSTNTAQSTSAESTLTSKASTALPESEQNTNTSTSSQSVAASETSQAVSEQSTGSISNRTTNITDKSTTTTTKPSAVTQSTSVSTQGTVEANESSTSPQDPTPSLNGWQNNKYYRDGKYLTGQQNINGQWYLFNTDGTAVVGLFDNGQNKQYYQKDFSQLRNGYYRKDPKTVYYFDGNGNAIVGLRQYIDASGQTQVEFYNNDNTQLMNQYYTVNPTAPNEKDFITYYFGSNGLAIKGLNPFNNGFQYFNDKGVMVRDGYYTKNPSVSNPTDQITYYFTDHGVSFKGLRIYNDGKSTQFYGDDSVMKRNFYYTSNPNETDEAKQITYYFGNDGLAVKGLHSFNGKYQYFNGNGIMLRDGYYTTNPGVSNPADQITYYFTPHGVSYTGLRVYNSGKNTQFYGDDSVMKRHVYYTSNPNEKDEAKQVTYYFGDDGLAVKGLQPFGNGYQYFKSNGVMLRDGYYTSNPDAKNTANQKTYYFTPHGVSFKGLRVYNNGKNTQYYDANSVMRRNGYYTSNPNEKNEAKQITYFFKDDGLAFKGLQSYNNGYRYFDDRGVMRRDGYFTTNPGVSRPADQVTYYFTAHGVSFKGLRVYNNGKNIQYYDNNSRMVRSDRRQANNQNYVFGSNGLGKIVKTPAGYATDQLQNAEYIYHFFKQRDWTVNAIAGVLGNMSRESMLRPNTWQFGGGGGYGLVQWTPPTALINWCKNNHFDYTSLSGQCNFLYNQMKYNIGGQWIPTASHPLSVNQFIHSTASVSYLTSAFEDEFERAGVVAPQDRINAGNAWYNYFKNFE